MSVDAQKWLKCSDGREKSTIWKNGGLIGFFAQNCTHVCVCVPPVCYGIMCVHRASNFSITASIDVHIFSTTNRFHNEAANWIPVLYAIYVENTIHSNPDSPDVHIHKIQYCTALWALPVWNREKLWYNSIFQVVSFCNQRVILIYNSIMQQ